jgi:hypothetical protein
VVTLTHMTTALGDNEDPALPVVRANLDGDIGERLVVVRAVLAPGQAIAYAQAIFTAAAMAATASGPLAADYEWRYAKYDDPMGGKRHHAQVTSNDSATFGFPYGGHAQYPTLTLRNDANHGLNIYFSIEKGHILCDDYSNQTIAVRFDDEPATTARCIEPADHSVDLIFLGREDWLLEKIRKARKLTLGVTFYQAGTRYFSFPIADLDTSKLGLNKPAKTTASR